MSDVSSHVFSMTRPKKKVPKKSTQSTFQKVKRIVATSAFSGYHTILGNGLVYPTPNYI